jgi:hypothetical protein
MSRECRHISEAVHVKPGGYGRWKIGATSPGTRSSEYSSSRRSPSGVNIKAAALVARPR